LWEVSILAQKKRIHADLVHFEIWLDAMISTTGEQVVPLDIKVASRSLNLKWDHGDLSDRLIVASALVKEASLITADKVIYKHRRALKLNVIKP